MQGLMQRRNLLISSILEHAARHHGAGEVVSRRDDGSLSRTTYAALARRARKTAMVLRGLGVAPGDRVGTLAMNSDRHFELYYGISGLGAVCNTINPRLVPDDIAYIIGHAEDGLVFADPTFLPILQRPTPTRVSSNSSTRTRFRCWIRDSQWSRSFGNHWTFTICTIARNGETRFCTCWSKWA